MFKNLFKEKQLKLSAILVLIVTLTLLISKTTFASEVTSETTSEVTSEATSEVTSETTSEATSDAPSTEETEKISINIFKDDAFREYMTTVEKLDADKDGLLTVEELNAVDTINTRSVKSGTIYSLEGIEYLPNLTRLWCQN